MQKKIKKYITTNEKAIAAARGARTLWRTGAVLVPAAGSAYLLVKFDDIIVLVLGVCLALFALKQLVTGMWHAEVEKVQA